MASPQSWPYVSVIVPMYNEAERIEGLLAALVRQTYPQDSFEVIVVDNGSADDTLGRCQRFRALPLRIAEETKIQGPDAARNRGLAIARGKIIAFTDADCRPDPTWLAEGVSAMLAEAADLVGGSVRFISGVAPSFAEVYDSINFLQQEHSVANRGMAFTANLFVRHEIFARIGGFPVLPGWNGDAAFTAKATGEGCRLIYAAAAVVSHPARGYRELATKVWRIGFGQGLSGPLAVDGNSHQQRLKSSLGASFRKPHFAHLWPPSLIRSLKSRRVGWDARATLILWCLSVTVILIGGIAFLKGRWLRLISDGPRILKFVSPDYRRPQ